jgi:hypothetical protein
MIEFRCWYCNRRHTAPKSRVGERIVCGCQYPLRVPKRSGGSCRVKTLVDWLVEIVVYGGAGGAVGFCVAAFGALPVHFHARPCSDVVLDLGWMSAAGFLGGVVIGLLRGEPAIDWLGRFRRRGEDQPGHE